MQRLVDNVLAITKESVKTFTYEFLNNIVRFINGISAIVLAFLPGKTSILEGIHGWELRPTFRGPRLPQWMENGVSSFNQFIHELSVDSDTSSVDYSSGDEDSDGYPPTLYSQNSWISRTSSFPKIDQRWTTHIRCIIFWMMFPVRFLFGIPLYFYHAVFDKQPNDPSNLARSSSFSSRLNKRTQNLRDHFVQRTTDRRHGVIEDLHLATEIFIEATFDIVYKAVHWILSPLDTLQKLLGWLFGYNDGNGDANTSNEEVTVTSSTLGEAEPTPTVRKTPFPQSLNTDARTCEDVIRELGYPYEAISVVTADGYILSLERIPRRDARKVVYLQHGIMDSSMGWVANGIVGSPAFAAYDQGYDVFLGNLRGLVSREHVDKNISSRLYWRYSINEHGTEDVPAMVDKIHEIKMFELESTGPNSDDTGNEINSDQPYKLSVISHSLGGAAILMYVITRRIEEKPHRLSRLILLSPAGFHDDSSFMFTAVEYIFLFLAPVLVPFLPGLYIPTRFFRMLFNKLARDFHNYPAVGGLVQTLMSYLTGGDSSNWVGVIGLPHYNINDMPGVSILVALHLAQMKHKGKFVMFDYGSEAANTEIYGATEPLDLGEYYRFIDIPVDLVAGKKDKIIRPSMVRKHYRLMRDSKVDVSYNEFEYAHLDFTFSHHEELLAYVISRLRLVEATQKPLNGLKPMRLKQQETSHEDVD